MKKRLILLFFMLILVFPVSCNKLQPVTNDNLDVLNIFQENRMNILIVLVNVDDYKISTNSQEWYDKYFNKEVMSVNNYYNTLSNGKFEILPAKETFGVENDGVIELNLPINHPIVDLENKDEKDIFVEVLFDELDKYIDFSDYDNDSNGILLPEELCVNYVIAGYEMDFERIGEPATWAHMDLTSNDEHYINKDGVDILTYAMLGELIYDNYLDQDRINTLEIICHELGHTLGLPDLYDTDDSSQGVGIHSLMGGGIYVNYEGGINDLPVELDAWSRIFLGFVKPSTVSETGKYYLYSTSTSKYNVLKILTNREGEYFLLENRQLEGFNESLKGYVEHSGVCIWHVDESVIREDLYNDNGFINIAVVNDNDKRKGIDLEEANESILGYCQLDGNEYAYDKKYDHYYYLGGIDTFGAKTHPNSSLNDGSYSGITIIVGESGPVTEVEVIFE